MMYLGWQQSITSADLEIVGQGHISQRVTSRLLSTDINQMFSMNDDACTELSLQYVQALFSMPCLHYMDAPHKPAIYLRFTALV